MELEVLNVEVNLLAVLLVAVLHMVLGMTWYGFFAKEWMKLNNLTEADAQKDAPVSYGGSILSAFGYGFVLSVIVGFVRLTDSSYSDLEAGLITGLLASFLGGGQFVSNYLFSKRPKKLLLIDGGFVLLNFFAAALVVSFI